MVERIDNEAGFAGLKDEWTQLLESSSSHCLFLTWEWLYAWWRRLGGRKKLSILAVRRDGRLIAIAPLAVSAPDYSRLQPFRIVEFLGIGFVGSDYLDVIARSGKEQEALDELAEYLAPAKLMLRLGQLRRRACLAERLALQLAQRGWTLSGATINVCPYINLSGHSWQSFLAALGSEHRYNFQRRWKNLGKQFEVSYERACSDERRREALGALIALHNRRWAERDGGSDAFHLPGLVSFHEEFSRLALQRGWLRLSLLSLNGRPAASLYGFRFGKVFYFYQSGFDPEYRKYSLGLVTMGLAIKGAIEEGAEEYDLLHGNEPYKAHWAREARELGRLEIYPPGPRGAFYKHAIGLGRAGRGMARQVLQTTLAGRVRAAQRG